MHVTRKTNQELVIVDSLVWLSVLMLCAAAFIAYKVMLDPTGKAYFGLVLALLFALIALRRETVVFDRAMQQVRWKRLRSFKVASGELPFSAITGIAIEALASGSGGQTYRLAIQTADQPLPMADAYGNSRLHYEALRKEVLEFLHIDNHQSAPASDSDDEASIRSLLMEGRKIEAVKMLRTRQNIGLAEAVDQVESIEQKLKAAR